MADKSLHFSWIAGSVKPGEEMHEELDQRIIRASSEAVSCELAGETVILDMASGRYFALNPIGTQVWDWIQTPCTLAELCRRLLEEYDVSPETCRHDVSALLNQLAQQGLVQFDGAAGT